MHPEHFHNLVNSLKPYNAQLVVVSKFRSDAEIESVYGWGQRMFGENRVQELTAKRTRLPLDIQWHVIGTLQRNKVRQLTPGVSLIHSADSFQLLEEIDKNARKWGEVQDCLLQCKIATEDSKSGFTEAELLAHAERGFFKGMEHVRICGVMGMGTFTSDNKQTAREFRQLRQTFQKLQSGYFAGKDWFREISAGMSDDFPIALDEGSTIVRIGSLVFQS